MAIADWPIVKQIAPLFGLIMRALYNVLALVGIENIAICIILFTFISKFIMIPSTYNKQKFTLLAPRVLPIVNDKIKKFEGRLDHPLVQNKLNIDKGVILNKYSMASSNGCLVALLQLPVLFALYAIVQDMPRFVPELNALSETAFNEAHMFFGMDIRNIPGFEFSPMYIFPILSAGLQLVETVLNSHMNKAVNNGKMVGGISNALMLGMTFYFAASFPIICSLYWIARSLVDITITFILQTYIKSKPLEFFAERTLARKNKDRAKRGLEPLVA